MRVLHYVLFIALDISLAVALLKADKRWLQREAVRARGWNYATFGAAMYQVGSLGALAWFVVTRFRYTRLVLPRAGFPKRRLVTRAARLVLGLLTGVAAVVLLATTRTLIDEAVFSDLLGLPPFMRLR